ncbi:MAG: hypothetical protein QOG53_1514 [Frankiales bacterium]|jgi:hypothetical protein|nr:hypothetical protein [Frankiales bacterium]
MTAPASQFNREVLALTRLVDPQAPNASVESWRALTSRTPVHDYKLLAVALRDVLPTLYSLGYTDYYRFITRLAAMHDVYEVLPALLLIAEEYTDADAIAAAAGLATNPGVRPADISRVESIMTRVARGESLVGPAGLAARIRFDPDCDPGDDPDFRLLKSQRWPGTIEPDEYAHLPLPPLVAVSEVEAPARDLWVLLGDLRVVGAGVRRLPAAQREISAVHGAAWLGPQVLRVAWRAMPDTSSAPALQLTDTLESFSARLHALQVIDTRLAQMGQRRLRIQDFIALTVDQASPDETLSDAAVYAAGEAGAITLELAQLRRRTYEVRREAFEEALRAFVHDASDRPALPAGTGSGIGYEVLVAALAQQLGPTRTDEPDFQKGIELAVGRLVGERVLTYVGQDQLAWSTDEPGHEIQT